MHDINFLVALAMLAILGGGFIAMACFGASQALVMSLVACSFLVLAADKAPAIVREGFAEFSTVALIFSAIALPAHQLQRSALFELVGAQVGRAIGYVGLRSPKIQVGALVMLMLVLIWIGAGFYHKIT